MKKKPDRLFRYTSFPVLLHILHTRSITLLDPRKWEDQNDTHFLERYRQLSGAETVLALCFTMASERAHHWEMFASGDSGLRIEFRKEELLSQFPPNEGVRHGAVTYRSIRHMQRNPPEIEQLPFLKRLPYRDEMEYRVIFSSADEAIHSRSLPLDLSCIARISLSPWTPVPLVAPLKDTIGNIEGCRRIKVSRTTLLENEDWQGIAEKMVNKSIHRT